MKAQNLYLLGTDVLVQPHTRRQDEAAHVAEQAVKEVEAAEAPDVGPVLVAQKRRVLKSEIPGISDEAWTDFVLAMKTASPGSVSASNAHGMFELKIRRLADLGYAKNLSYKRSPLGRMVWAGDFVAPLTRDKFLKDRGLQYKVFCESIKDYLAKLQSGQIAQPEDDDGALSTSGMVAILHRCGPNGLARWQDELRFPETVELCERANGIF